MHDDIKNWKAAMEGWKESNGVSDIDEAEDVIADAVGLVDDARALIESLVIRLEEAGGSLE